MAITPHESISVTVRILWSGEDNNYIISPNDTLSALKNRVSECNPDVVPPADLTHLLFGGEPIDDDTTFVEHGIEDGAVLFLQWGDIEKVKVTIAIACEDHQVHLWSQEPLTAGLKRQPLALSM